MSLEREKESLHMTNEIHGTTCILLETSFLSTG